MAVVRKFLFDNDFGAAPASPASGARAAAGAAAGKGAGVDGVCGPAKAGTLCGPPPSCVNGVETTQGACDGASV